MHISDQRHTFNLPPMTQQGQRSQHWPIHTENLEALNVLKKFFSNDCASICIQPVILHPRPSATCYIATPARDHRKAYQQLWLRSHCKRLNLAHQHTSMTMTTICPPQPGQKFLSAPSRKMFYDEDPTQNMDDGGCLPSEQGQYSLVGPSPLVFDNMGK